MKQKLHNPLGLIIPWALAFLVSISYAIYWNLAANKISQAFQSQNANKFAYSKIEVNGFPIRFSVKIRDFSLPIGEGKFATGEIDLTSRPMSPNLWTLDNLKGANYIDNLGNRTEINPKNIRATLHFNYDNLSPKIQRLSLEAQEIGFLTANRNLNLSNLKWHLIGDTKTNSYAFSIEVNGLSQFEPFKSAHINPKILRGLIINADKFDSGYNVWRDNYGQIALKYGEIELSQWGIMKSGLLNNLSGNIAIDKDNKFKGIIDNNAEIILLSDKKITLPNFQIHIEDSKIDMEKSMRSIDFQKLLENNKF